MTGSRPVACQADRDLIEDRLPDIEDRSVEPELLSHTEPEAT